MPKITDTACKNAAVDAKLWDSEVKGFALFAGKTRKTFFFQRDVNGKTVRDKIGIWGEINAAQARTEATMLAADHASGTVAKRLRTARTPTLEAALASYIARPKLRSGDNKAVVEGQMRVHLKDWLNIPLDQIDRAMCARAHARLSVPWASKDTKGRARILGGERAANHTMKSFRSIWNHVRRTYDLPECPTISIEWHNEEPPKTVIEDFEKWKAAVNALENPVHQAFYRFLLFTGLRKSEAMTLRWDQVFDDHLHLPLTKNGRAFDLPLLPAHHDILAPMKAYRSDFVFHGQRQAEHLASPASIPWSPHTHRRTFATVAENRAGLLEETVGRLLNHTPKSVTGRHYVAVDYKRLHKPMTDVVDALMELHLI